MLLEIENLTLVGGMVVGIGNEGNKFSHVILNDGREISGDRVRLGSGTFLNGLIHIGEEQTAAGRVNEAPSLHLSESLQSLGFKPGRLKTGTPPRLEGEYDRLLEDGTTTGDDQFLPFSLRTIGAVQNRVKCHITYTTAETHKIVEANIHRFGDVFR